MLTANQKQAARKLLDLRPPVIPDTRVIVDNAARKAWYDRVYSAMRDEGVQDCDIQKFCDIAGVPG